MTSRVFVAAAILVALATIGVGILVNGGDRQQCVSLPSESKSSVAPTSYVLGIEYVGNDPRSIDRTEGFVRLSLQDIDPKKAVVVSVILVVDGQTRPLTSECLRHQRVLETSEIELAIYDSASQPTKDSMDRSFSDLRARQVDLIVEAVKHEIRQTSPVQPEVVKVSPRPLWNAVEIERMEMEGRNGQGDTIVSILSPLVSSASDCFDIRGVDPSLDMESGNQMSSLVKACLETKQLSVGRADRVRLVVIGDHSPALSSATSAALCEYALEGICLSD